MVNLCFLKMMVLSILFTSYLLKTVEHFHFHFSESQIKEDIDNSDNQQEEQEEEKPRYAEAFLKNPITNLTLGRIFFSQNSSDSSITIKISLHGLNPNSTQALIIHELGITKSGCSDLGKHFNPFNKQHGAREDQERHVGDLGNVKSNSLGNIEMEFTDELVTLYGPYSVIGRGIVLHSSEDDYGKGNNDASKETGNVGGGMACGIIGHSEHD